MTLKAFHPILIGLMLQVPSAFGAADNEPNKDLPKTKQGAIEAKLLESTSRDQDYNYTLNSQYLKHKVVYLGDLIANASLFAGTGYVRDHKRGKFIFLEHPPIGKRILLAQVHKLKYMAASLHRTRDDDYNLAGDLLMKLAEALTAGNNQTAMRQVLLFEEIYKGDLEKPANADAKGEQAVRQIAEDIVGNVKSLFGEFAGEIQAKALDILNYNNLMGGLQL